MGKSSFSLKLTQLDKKSLKNDQKSINFSHHKLGHNLTTKRGDSGSAPLLEIKCVIIEALNLVTENDQKQSQH